LAQAADKLSLAHRNLGNPKKTAMTMARLALGLALLGNGLAQGKVIGTCGAASPSKVEDCQNVDVGTCGNACCTLIFAVQEAPEVAMKLINNSLADGGPDGYYTLQMTAEGTLGFGDLRPFKVPSGQQFIGQAHHEASGPKHYNDTVNFNIRPQQCSHGQECNGQGSIIVAFSTSQIGGALGDNGQNYKNIVMGMKAAKWKEDITKNLGFVGNACSPPASKVVV